MSAVAATLQRAWLSRGLLAWVLSPVSALMWSLVATRRLAYRLGWLRRHGLPRTVLVVGNRIVGGAGKTPTTLALLTHLRATGWCPGVLTRGYGARHAPGDHALILDAESAPSLTADQTGDEPLLLWRRTGVPLAIDRDRVRGGQALLARHPEIDILVCDDGLQHLRLARDIEVVVFDERGQGNGWLLPAGPLREPIETQPLPGLSAAPLVLYNGCPPSTPLPGFRGAATLGELQALANWWRGVRTEDRPSPADSLARPYLALAGVAHPQRFFDGLRQQGWHITELPLPDHADMATLPWPDQPCDLIVTEKDAVKLAPDRLARERPLTRVWVAPLDFQPEPAFWQALDDALARARRRPAA